MPLSIGFGEIVSIVTISIGAGWTLLKITFGQFEKRLDVKFLTQSERISNIEEAAKKIQQLELDTARRDASLALHYVLREEYRVDQVEIKQNLNQIFTLLREIAGQNGNFVTKTECTACKKQ